MVHGDDGLEMEQRAGQRLNAADPAAAGQVLQRVKGEDGLGLPPQVCQARFDLLQPPACSGCVCCRQHLEPLPARQGCGVPDGDLRFSSGKLAPEAGGVRGAAEARRDVNRKNLFAVPHQLFVDLPEHAS